MFEDPAFAYLAVGSTAAVLLVVAAFDRWLPVVLLLFFGVLANQLQIDLSLTVGAQSISPVDLTFSICAVAAGLRMIGGGRLDRLQVLWLALTAFALLAFVRGASDFGLEAAGSSYRYWFYMTAGTLYFLSFPWDALQMDRLARLLLVLVGILAVTIIVLWIDPDLSPLSDELVGRQFAYAYESQRVVGASTAFLVGEAGLIGLAAWLGTRSLPTTRMAGIAFLIMIVPLYHRSVWLAIAVGIVTMMVLHRGKLHRLGVPLFLGLVLLVVSILLGEGLGHSFFGDRIDSAITEALDDDSTLNWRVQGWEVLLSRAIAGGPVVWLFGAGFGVSYERAFGDYLTNVSPHNLYVELFLNTGFAGVSLWLWFHLRMLAQLYRSIGIDEPDFLNRRTVIALVVAMMTYCLPYSLSIEQAALLGAFGAFSSRWARETAVGVVADSRAA